MNLKIEVKDKSTRRLFYRNVNDYNSTIDIEAPVFTVSELLTNDMHDATILIKNDLEDECQGQDSMETFFHNVYKLAYISLIDIEALACTVSEILTNDMHDAMIL